MINIYTINIYVRKLGGWSGDEEDEASPSWIECDAIGARA